MIILGCGVAQLVRTRVNDRKVAGLMPLLGTNANYQKTLRVMWKTSTGVCFTTACTGEKRMK